MNIHQPNYQVKEGKAFIEFYTMEEPDKYNRLTKIGYFGIYYDKALKEYAASKQTLEVHPDSVDEIERLIRFNENNNLPLYVYEYADFDISFLAGRLEVVKERIIDPYASGIEMDEFQQYIKLKEVERGVVITKDVFSDMKPFEPSDTSKYSFQIKEVEENNNDIIKWIAKRIKDEERKHSKNDDNWYEIAARKIYASYDIKLKIK